jgi:hypothetical protein
MKGLDNNHIGQAGIHANPGIFCSDHLKRERILSSGIAGFREINLAAGR